MFLSESSGGSKITLVTVLSKAHNTADLLKAELAILLKDFVRLQVRFQNSGEASWEVYVAGIGGG